MVGGSNSHLMREVKTTTKILTGEKAHWKEVTIPSFYLEICVLISPVSNGGGE